jgi:ATP-dependent DNA helicase PIF1
MASQHPLKRRRVPKRKAQGNIFERAKRKSKQWSEETRKVIRLVKEGKNVEMIGQAGTGKTFTLKRLMMVMDRMYIPYVMTASTGRAALNIGGQTIHSFSGAGIGDQYPELYIKKVCGSRWYRKAWRRPKVLIIEEISMLGMEYFDLLDKMARAVRKTDLPFGGLQVVVCGDYLQLPPVNAKYVFHSQIYQQLFSDKTCKVVFRDIKRQSCPKLIRILQDARIGHLSQWSIDMLTACVEKPVPEDLPVKPMILFARRMDVRGFNMKELDQLEGECKKFLYTWQPSPSLSQTENEIIHKTLQRNLQAPMELCLKVGAQVMLVRNMPDLVPPKFNGSMGVITKFCPNTKAPVVKFTDGSVVVVPKCEWTGPRGKGKYIQYPLILGWALTIHKAQGATVDCARIDLGPKVSQANQAYTALSRVRSLDGLFLDDFDPSAFRAHAEALAYHVAIGECSIK